MTYEKITIERLRQLAGGDPFNVRGDPELQLAAVKAALVRYEETRTNADLDAWIGVIAATMDLGTNVSPLEEYLVELKALYGMRAQGSLSPVDEHALTTHLEEIWGLLDEYDRMVVEDITERFKVRP